jgi:AraC-binding-like domain
VRTVTCMNGWAMPRKPLQSDAIPVFRFSTDAFPERERIAAWREIFGRTVVNLDIEPLNPDGFRAEAAVCQLPGLGVLRASSAAVHLHHTRNLIVNDDLSFMAAPTCPYTASQHGRDPVLGPGDGVLEQISLGSNREDSQYLINERVCRH